MSWHEDALALARQVADRDVTGAEGLGPYTLDVPAGTWREVHAALRGELGCTYLDWLSASDELTAGLRVACHVARLTGGLRHLLVTTLVPREAPVLVSLVPVHAGAGWHERETHEMFGIDFTGGDALDPLLLPDGFEGHPLRKDFVLASRAAVSWPGAKEPGESDADAAASPSRRRQRPPGVPLPDDWGPRPAGSPAPDPLAAAAGEGTRRPRLDHRSRP